MINSNTLEKFEKEAAKQYPFFPKKQFASVESYQMHIAHSNKMRAEYVFRCMEKEQAAIYEFKKSAEYLAKISARPEEISVKRLLELITQHEYWIGEKVDTKKLRELITQIQDEAVANG